MDRALVNCKNLQSVFILAVLTLCFGCIFLFLLAKSDLALILSLGPDQSLYLDATLKLMDVFVHVCVHTFINAERFMLARYFN